MVQMNPKKMIVATVAVLSTLAVAGCGSATDISGGQAASLSKSNFASTLSQATSSAKSVHMTGTFTVQGQHLTLSADESMGDLASVKDVAVAMKLSMGSEGTIEVRMVAGVLYINAAPLGLAQNAAKPWVKVDLNDPNNPLGSMFGQITKNLDPAQLLASFKSISTLTTVGPENIDGIQTTHYRVTVDTSKIASTLGLPAGDAASKLPKTLTYDVWLDADNRPFQISVINPQLTMTLHFSHWGEPVHVVAPPASQVSSFSL